MLRTSATVHRKAHEVVCCYYLIYITERTNISIVIKLQFILLANFIYIFDVSDILGNVRDFCLGILVVRRNA